tara:strand:- start:746 stop:1141 length:396 start_codon:yes stop_codon:yes gene_type:complete
MKTPSKIYILNFQDGKILFCKSILELHNDYLNHTSLYNKDLKFDRFKYIINNNLFNSDKKYTHKSIEYDYKLIDINTINIYNLKEYLQNYYNDYLKAKERLGNKIIHHKPSVEKLKYTQLYKQIKQETECN